VEYDLCKRYRVQGIGYKVLTLNLDELVKSPEIVMPDLIRHPELIEFTGFRLSPEGRKRELFDFLRNYQP